MAKVNTKSTHTTKTTNYEGGEAYELSPKAKLLNLTSTCLLNEPKFYGEFGETEENILNTAKIVSKKDPKFLLQLSAYLRNEMYLRSISTYLLVLAANTLESKKYVKEYTPKIIKRADEINESLAIHLEYFQNNGGKAIPNSLKKGIVNSFTNFDEYQFGKYNRKGKVTFKDAIMLTHPKEPSKIIKKILDDKLEVPYTWEVELSTKGNKPEVWESLIDSGKLPYMATLRNLRNILTTGDTGVSDAHIDKVIDFISNDDAVRKSKQFPFRFFSAYKQLAGSEYGSDGVTHPRVSDVLDALEEAIYISYENIPYMKGTTLIASDVSGSMDSPISRNSSIRQIDIGILLGSATHKYTDKSITGCFGNIWKTYSMSKRTAGIISNVPKIQQKAQEVGWSTNGYKVIEWLNENNKFVDRILIFTDMQLYDSNFGWLSGSENTIRKEFNKYKQNINPDAKIYMFNLNGYGTVNFPENDKSVININGWSDKVLRFIESVEQDPNIQVKYIEENY